MIYDTEFSSWFHALVYCRQASTDIPALGLGGIEQARTEKKKPSSSKGNMFFLSGIMTKFAVNSLSYIH